MEVGSSAESVTVTEAAPLLKTESGELSHNVTTDTMNNLPVMGIGASAGSAGIRNPYAVLQLLPGSDWHADSSVRINGMPSNTQTLRIEGQDSTSGISSSTQSTVQPSVDAIQEFAIQTSNYSAEFGQAGGGVFNVTMKSGSNQFHGTGLRLLCQRRSECRATVHKFRERPPPQAAAAQERLRFHRRRTSMDPPRL